MPKPRIVIFTRFFWPEGGGAELATYIIVRDILSKRFDVTVVSGTENPKTIPMQNVRYVHNTLFKASTKPELLLKMLLHQQAIGKLIRSADIVYIPSNAMLPLAILSKKVNPRVKVVVHLHDYQPLTYSAAILYSMELGLRTDLLAERYDHDSILRTVLAGIFRPINVVYRLALALDYADKIVFVSKRQLEIYLKHVPSVRTKAVVVYNPLPPVNALDKDPEEPLFLYTGGGRYTKGFHVLLQSAIQLLKCGKNVRFVFTGGAKGFSKQHLRIIDKLNKAFTHSFKVLGRIPYEEVLKLYSKSYAVLVPSVWEEPLPYVIVEAMATGTIPIASRIGGIPEIVEGTYAEKLLFEPWNYLELADRIERVATLSKRELLDIGISLREAIVKKLDHTKIEKSLKKAFIIH